MAAEARPWSAGGGPGAALQVVLLQRTYVLPWAQFLWAEGTAGEARLVFTTHEVRIEGNGLDTLLADVAAQRVALLHEPARTERFGAAAGPRITSVLVRRADEAGDG